MNRHEPLPRPLVALEVATFAYLALPMLLFAFGWLRPLVSIPLVALLLYGCFRALRPDPSNDPAPPVAGAWPPRLRPAQWGAIGVAIATVLLFSGIGGFGLQHGDYSRHNALLLDLSELPWPLAYAETGPDAQPRVLAFYMGSALAPGAFGQLFGWGAANVASWLWAGAGVTLATSWFLRTSGRYSVGFALLFLLFGGLDLLGEVVLHRAETLRTVGIYPLDLWQPGYLRAWGAGGVGGLYSSALSLLYSAPQHLFGTWLAVLVIVYDAAVAGHCRRAGLVSALALLGSPLGFVGLVPFVLAALFVTRMRGAFSIVNLGAGVAILAVLVLFFASNDQSYPRGPIWEFLDLRRAIPAFFVVWLVEFGIYLAVRPRGDAQDAAVGLLHPVWRWSAVAWLCGLAFYRLGFYNELLSKGSIAALLVVQLVLARSIVVSGASRAEILRRRVLVTLLVIGTGAALSTHVIWVATGIRTRQLPPPDRASVLHMHRIGPLDKALQLFSDGDGFFWRTLARSPEYYREDERR